MPAQSSAIAAPIIGARNCLQDRRPASLGFHSQPHMLAAYLGCYCPGFAVGDHNGRVPRYHGQKRTFRPLPHFRPRTYGCHPWGRGSHECAGGNAVGTDDSYH